MALWALWPTVGQAQTSHLTLPFAQRPTLSGGDERTLRLELGGLVLPEQPYDPSATPHASSLTTLRADVLSTAGGLIVSSPGRLLFVTRRGTRFTTAGSTTVGSSGLGLAPLPLLLDPSVVTQRHQLRIDGPRGWSFIAELASATPGQGQGARTTAPTGTRAYFVGILAPPRRRRLRWGVGAFGDGERAGGFGFVLRW